MADQAHIAQFTIRFIRNNFPKYASAEDVSKDVKEALRHYSGLVVCKRESVVEGYLYYTINLEGTIPADYRGTIYNIPVRITLMENYPDSAPIVYLQPTHEMRISNMAYLSGHGKVSTAYLQNWKTHRHPDIYKTILKLCDLFGEKPPLWSKKPGVLEKAYQSGTRFVEMDPPKLMVQESEQRQYSQSGLPIETIGSFSPDFELMNAKQSGSGLCLPGGKSPSAPLNGNVDDNQTYVQNMNEKSSPSGSQGAFGGKQPAKASSRQSAQADTQSKEITLASKNQTKVLKNYTCIERIGYGGFAKVYLYQNNKTKHKVACKIVDLGVNDTAVQKHSKALKHEVNLLSSLDHPFIVKYISMEEEDNKLAMVMEYFTLGSLYSVLLATPGNRFKESRARVYTWQILQGLIYLHDNGIIHKDIKARNILLDEQDIVRIADFGISKKMETLITHTTGGNSENLGTVFWQSPECFSDKKCGRKTDIWSLGCTVVEFLYGKPPLLDLGRLPAMAKIMNAEVSPPDDCSDIAKDFLQRCFRRVEHRPTAKQLMAETDFPTTTMQN